MVSRLMRCLPSGLIFNATFPLDALAAESPVSVAQPAPAPSAPVQPAPAQTFNAEQLDALLASIALYPDELLTQLLMASTFPLEVVAAARWVEDPAHKSLSGEALENALEAEPWDPSVKSLVPFPVVLATLNNNLPWLQQLGYAFATQQADVFASIQRLRQRAQTSGHLQSSPQQVVSTQKVTLAPGSSGGNAGAGGQVGTQQEVIVIAPAQTDTVYVPSYDPGTVYGDWPYASYPPYYAAPPTGYYFGTALATGLAFAAGAAVVGGLWGWARPAWGGGYANINVNRWNGINVNRGQLTSNRFQANFAGNRPANFARAPRGPVGLPGRSQVSVPGSAVRPPTRAGRVAGAGGVGGAGRAGGPGGVGGVGGAGRPGGPGGVGGVGGAGRPGGPGGVGGVGGAGRPGGPGGVGGVGGAGRPGGPGRVGGVSGAARPGGRGGVGGVGGPGRPGGLGGAGGVSGAGRVGSAGGAGGIGGAGRAGGPGGVGGIGGAGRPTQRPAGGQRFAGAQRPSGAFGDMSSGRRAGQFGQRGAQSRSFAQQRSSGGFGGARGGGGFAGRGGGGFGGRGGGGRGGGRR